MDAPHLEARARECWAEIMGRPQSAWRGAAELDNGRLLARLRLMRAAGGTATPCGQWQIVRLGETCMVVADSVWAESGRPPL